MTLCHMSHSWTTPEDVTVTKIPTAIEEVDASCTRAMIIDQGKIVAEGSPASLREDGDGSLTELFRKLTTSDVAA